MKTKYKGALIYLLLSLIVILSLTVPLFVSGCGGRGIDIGSGDDNGDNDNNTAPTTSSTDEETDNESETTEFSVNSSDIDEKELISMTTADREAFVAALDEKYKELFKSLKVSKSYKSAKNHNPLITQRFGADPFAMVYDGRVYVYTTNDVYEYENGKIKSNSYGKINTINCISSADLVNWTDHGTIPVTQIAKWAWNSWAPCATWREIDGKVKFFLYFANSAGGIGVLEADSPTGPWKDPLGRALITKSTPNCADVTWLFDPAILVDDDGSAYLYFGGGIPGEQYAHPKTARVVKLKDDMISLDGTPVTIDAPFFFEDSGINKINGKYYYSYCLNWSDDVNEKNPAKANIAYMVSDSPMGPFTYVGTFLQNPGVFFDGLYGNNHHSVIEFKGQYYVFYHAMYLEKKMNGVSNGYRSAHVNKVKINDNGTIAQVQANVAGVDQVAFLDPYAWNEAETISFMGGVETIKTTEKSPNFSANMVAEVSEGDFICVQGVNFGDGAGTAGLKVRVASGGSKGSAIKVSLDSRTGDAVAYVEVPSTGGITTYTDIIVPTKNITGVHDVYFSFWGDEFRIDGWQFLSE